MEAWRTVETEDGETYWWNEATGETTWEDPAGNKVPGEIVTNPLNEGGPKSSARPVSNPLKLRFPVSDGRGTPSGTSAIPHFDGIETANQSNAKHTGFDGKITSKGFCCGRMCGRQFCLFGVLILFFVLIAGGAVAGTILGESPHHLYSSVLSPLVGSTG